MLPVSLNMVQGTSDTEHRDIVRRTSLYAATLLFLFLILGTLILKIFGVYLSMVRVVGGMVLLRIGFDLFSGSASGASMVVPQRKDQWDIAVVPLAMPVMCGAGAIAIVLGIASLVKHSQFEFMTFLAIGAATILTMAVTLLCLAYANELIGRIGPLGVDAVPRVVGFFVAAMGGGLIFQGVIEALHDCGVLAAH